MSSKRSLLFVVLVLFVAAVAVVPAQPARAEPNTGTLIVELNATCGNAQSLPNLMPNNYFTAQVKYGPNFDTYGGGQMNYSTAVGNYRVYKFQSNTFPANIYYARFGRISGPWAPGWSSWIGPKTLYEGGLVYWTFWLHAFGEMGCPA